MRRLAALLLAALLTTTLMAGCASETAGHNAAPEVVVGSAPDAGSTLLAALYLAALHSYGFGARAATAVDPMAKAESPRRSASCADLTPPSPRTHGRSRLSFIVDWRPIFIRPP